MYLLQLELIVQSMLNSLIPDNSNFMSHHRQIWIFHCDGCHHTIIELK